jgi:hypothetical protein
MFSKIIFPILSFGGWLYILKWILELENTKCSCSELWLRPTIKYFIYYLLIANIVFLLFPLRFNWYFVIHFISVIVFISFTRVYIDYLRKHNCKCLEKNRMWMVDLTNFLQFIGFGILLGIVSYKRYKSYIKI